MPDDHSEVVPLLPIPNRTVKRLCADDSADSRVKVGHRQAVIARRPVYGRGVLISAPWRRSVRVLMRTQKACYNVSLHRQCWSRRKATTSKVGDNHES